MDIEMSDKTLVEMAALAVENSIPVGMGRLHYRILTPEYSREIRERIARATTSQRVEFTSTILMVEW